MTPVDALAEALNQELARIKTGEAFVDQPDHYTDGDFLARACLRAIGEEKVLGRELLDQHLAVVLLAYGLKNDHLVEAMYDAILRVFAEAGRK